MRSKDGVTRTQAMLDEARRKGRRACLEAFEKGASTTELADYWGTSFSRMKQMLAQAKEERG